MKVKKDDAKQSNTNIMPKDYGNDIDYRTIAMRLSKGSNEPLTYIGVRAAFIRIMKKFAMEYIAIYRPELTGIKKVKEADILAKSVKFQIAIGDYLHKTWR